MSAIDFDSLLVDCDVKIRFLAIGWARLPRDSLDGVHWKEGMANELGLRRSPAALTEEGVDRGHEWPGNKLETTNVDEVLPRGWSCDIIKPGRAIRMLHKHKYTVGRQESTVTFGK
jgi:hypothetical protein